VLLGKAHEIIAESSSSSCSTRSGRPRTSQHAASDFTKQPITMSTMMMSKDDLDLTTTTTASTATAAAADFMNLRRTQSLTQFDLPSQQMVITTTTTTNLLPQHTVAAVVVIYYLNNHILSIALTVLAQDAASCN